MKKTGLIILTILIMFVTANVYAEKYSSDFFEYKELSRIDKTVGGFQTPYVDILYNNLSNVTLTNGSQAIRLTGEIKGHSDFLKNFRYKIHVELYDSNKTLLKTYEDEIESRGTAINEKLDNISQYNPKYYKVVFELLDDYYNVEEYNQNDYVVGKMKTEIMPDYDKSEGKDNDEKAKHFYILYKEELDLYIKSGKEFVRTIPKKYKNKDTNEIYTLKLQPAESEYDLKNKYTKISEDENNYYIKLHEPSEKTFDHVAFSYDFTIEAQSETKNILLPVLPSVPDAPVKKLEIKLDNTMGAYNMIKILYTGEKILTSDYLGNKKMVISKEDNNFEPDFPHEIITIEKANVTKDDYLYKYYFNEEEKQGKITEKSSNNDWLFIVIVVLVVAVIVVAMMVFRKPKQPPMTNTMNKLPMGPNQPPQPPMQQYNPNMNNQNNPNNRI